MHVYILWYLSFLVLTCLNWTITVSKVKTSCPYIKLPVFRGHNQQYSGTSLSRTGEAVSLGKVNAKHGLFELLTQ